MRALCLKSLRAHLPQPRLLVPRPLPLCLQSLLQILYRLLHQLFVKLGDSVQLGAQGSELRRRALSTARRRMPLLLLLRG